MMDSKARDALLYNRVKIMKFCDYFIVTAPLIARRILPLDKHKEFKSSVGQGPNLDPKAGNNARMDALLEFLDECTTPGAFDAFIEGIKNCEGQKTLAKVLKKHAEEGTAGLPPPRAPGAPGKPRAPAKPRSSLPIKRPFGGSPQIQPPPLAPFMFANSSIKVESPMGGVPKAGIFTSTPAPIKKEKKAAAKKNAVPMPNGPTGPGPIPAATPSTAKAPKKPRTPNPNAKPRSKPAPKIQLNGQGGVILKQEPNFAPTAAPPVKKKAAPRKKSSTKIVGPIPPVAPSTPVKLEFSGEPSTSKATPAALAAAAAKKPFVSKVPAGSPFRRRASAGGPSKLKKMSFQEAEEKQKSATRATTFSFVNPSAMVKTIHFNNKSDLFYEGCPTKENNQLCAKKVQLKGKGKKYVCKDKHENETYELFPRLYVTFEDNTTHMQTTLYRENVEVLAGKPVPDIHRMDDETLKIEFLKAHNKNIPIEVKCKKILKKEIKKSGGAAWDNVATIITDDGPSAPKRSRKSID